MGYARNKFIKIDGVTYPVKLIDVKRKADILDLQAYRTEDGGLFRKIIGTYVNYSVQVGIENDFDLYDRLFDVLSAPVYAHSIQLPNESAPQQRYTSSVEDGILRVEEDGTLYKDLTFNITCTNPTRRA